QLEPGANYNDYTAFRITGSLDVAALEKAIGEVVRRHEVLRATFQEKAGVPVQQITPYSGFKLNRIGLRGKPEPEVLAVAKREAQTLFDLRQGPLYRVTLLQLADDDFLLSLTMHHIVTDGWSIGVFRKELGALYEAYRVGLPSPLPELPLQYADFAAWQRAFLQGDELNKQL